MSREELVLELQNEEFRRQFVSAQVRRFVSGQIRDLREIDFRRWTQKELGMRAGGMKPNAISRLENPAYGDYSVNTLLRLADAFDLGLIVRFAAISEIVEWNQGISQWSYTPPSFSNDRKLFFSPSVSAGDETWRLFRELYI